MKEYISLNIGPVEVSACHALSPNMSFKCSHLHGHNYKIQAVINAIVSCNLPKPWMLVDGSDVRKILMQWDHAEVPVDCGTAEAMAQKLAMAVRDAVLASIPEGIGLLRVAVEVRETENLSAIYALEDVY